jgi:menaquinone-9 beta-reductase
VSLFDTEMSNLTGDWDAIIIGAGPAGAVSALLLARQGKRVLLVEKAPFPRTKVCGSCLSTKTLNYLNLAGLGDLPVELKAARISGIRLCTAAGALSLPLPVGLALSREALDGAIVARAQLAGAVFLSSTSASVGQCVGSTRTVKIRIANGRTTDQSDPTATPGQYCELVLSSRCVIVADGINGRALSDLDGSEGQLFKPQVAKASRIGAGTIVAGSGNEPGHYQTGTIYMAVHRGGYVGLVRLEDGRLDLAAAFDPSYTRRWGSPQAAARQILQGAGLPYPQVFDQSQWSGTAPFTRQRRTLASRRLFVAGDAASYGEPFTGEGIGWAIYSALLVVPLASAAIDNWNDKLALDWQNEYKKLIGDKQKMSLRLGALLRSDEMSSLVIGGVLQHMPALARPLIDRISR